MIILIIFPEFRTGGEPFDVFCGIRLLKINKIDPIDSSFSMNVAMKFYWVDNRVQLLTNRSEHKIHVDLDFLSLIWTPDFSTYDLQSFKILGMIDRGLLRVKKKKNDTGTATEVLMNFFSLCLDNDNFYRNSVHDRGKGGHFMSN